MNREHIWPDWLCEAIAMRFPDSRWKTFRPGGPERVLPTPVVKAGHVCEKCNGGWMSRLEGKTKPILEPLIFGDRLETELTPADQKTLAYWAIKTALTSDLERPVRMYPPSLYTHLFELHDPFPHALVWTAAYGTGGPDQIGSHVEPLSFTGLHADRSIFGTIDTDSIKMAGTLTTISLFRVLFQVFLFEWDKLPATYMIEAANTPGPIRRIWPTSDTFIWPPDLLALKDDAAFRRFTQRRPNLRGRPRK